MPREWFRRRCEFRGLARPRGSQFSKRWVGPSGSPGGVVRQATRPASRNADNPGAARWLGPRGTFRLEPPRLRTDADPAEERHETRFELYFDLVFAAALSQLGAALVRHPSAPVFARFAAMFIVVVWPWALYTMYANRFDTDDLIFRLSKAAGMLAIAALAVNLPRVMAGRGGTTGFAIGYVVLRIILIALYGRARAHVQGDGRRLCEVLIAGYGCTTLLWLGSVFVPDPDRYLLWTTAMLVDFAIPVRAWATLRGHAVVVSHLTERYGTFFIIVLGEAVIASVTGLSRLTFTFESWAVAAGCLVVALAMWWIYFDLADTSVVGRGVLGLIFVYGQFPLLAGVAAFGEGTKLAILETGHNGLSAGARWALGGGVGAFALSLALFHLGAESTSVHDRTFRGRIALGSVGVTLAAAGGSLSPFAFVALVGCAALGQLLLEARTPRAGSLDPEASGDTAIT